MIIRVIVVAVFLRQLVATTIKRDLIKLLLAVWWPDAQSAWDWLATLQARRQGGALGAFAPPNK